MLRSFVGGSIFGAQWGSGPPNVLALHGWARTHHDFDAVFDGFDDRPGVLDAIAIDLPGFGSTPPPSEPWDTAQYAEALRPLLAEMGDQIVVVGHSFGGRVAVRLARIEPRVSALVLSGVPLFRADQVSKRPHLGYRLIRGLARKRLVGNKALERARQRYGSRDYALASGVMRDVLVKTVMESYDDDLGALQIPVTLLWGEHDEVAPMHVAQQAAAMLRRASITVAVGAGHLTPTDAPDALREAVIQQLA